MPDRTPTTAEALAALDHENHDFVDEGDGRPCPVCEAAPTLRALAEQPRAVFPEAVKRDARAQLTADGSESVAVLVERADRLSRAILDAAEGERVAGEEGGDAGNGTDGLQEPPATPDPPPSTPAPPEAGVDTDALLEWAKVPGTKEGWVWQKVAEQMRAAAAEFDALRTRERTLREALKWLKLDGDILGVGDRTGDPDLPIVYKMLTRIDGKAAHDIGLALAALNASEESGG